MRRTWRVPGVLLLLAGGCTDKPADPVADEAATDSGVRVVTPRGGDDSAAPTDSASGDSSHPDTGTTPSPLRVLLANTGNLDEANGGPCPSAPYHGSTCSLTQEAELAGAIGELAPDIAILLEVLDVRTCTEDDLAGDPDLVCTGATERDPYQTARRLLGDGYTISCDARSSRSCVGVRAGRLTMSGCAAADLCIDGSTTAPHPESCGERGSLTSVSRVDLVWMGEAAALAPGTALSVIAAHALNATDEAGDACRRAQYEQAFSTLPGDGPTLVAGDMNMDPYRFPDLFPSAVYWHEQVGADRRFTAHSVDADPPAPTWMGLATLDYVLSDFLSGGCTVLSEALRMDAVGQTLDHRAVICSLE